METEQQVITIVPPMVKHLEQVWRCPVCRSDLKLAGEELQCRRCSRRYPFDANFPVLLADLEDRFDDESEPERDLHEERVSAFTMEHYTLPLITRLFPGSRALPLRILSDGCGVGVDVEMFTAAGHNAYGIDCGNRTWIWQRRSCPDRLAIANGKRLPFPDEFFDFVYAGCVIPHVGTVGDSAEVALDYNAQRLAFVQEMVRVTRPGGYILHATANKLCPVDPFHIAGPLPWVRLHSPREPFLLSYADHQDLFIRQAGCKATELLPMAGYWGFLKKSNSVAGRLAAQMMGLHFNLLSASWLSLFRSSPLNPWLIVLIRR